MLGRTMTALAVVAMVAAVITAQQAGDAGLQASTGTKATNGFYNGTDIMFNATMSVNVAYEYFDDAANETKTATGVVPVPDSYVADSVTEGDEQTLTVACYNGWLIKFTFANVTKDTTSTYNVSAVSVKYNTDTLTDEQKAKFFPKHNFTTGELSGDVSNSTVEYPIHAPLATTYQCLYGDTRLPVSDKVTVVLKDLKVQPFMADGDKHEWKSGDMCDADISQSDLVPIIVGAALVVLLIVVLVGYLVGRARAARQGYASV